MNSNADEIIALLSPIIGPGLARTAVSVQCRKMDIMPENLHGDVLAEFADRFKVPLQFFAGESVANDITERIKSLESPAAEQDHIRKNCGS